MGNTPTRRVSFSLPAPLLTEFNKVRVRKGFSDRSKAIQAALRLFISEFEWTGEDGGQVAGTVTLHYDPEVREIEANLTAIQHSYSPFINAAVHAHLDKRNCLEVVLVKGKTAKIKELANALSGLKGVKAVKTQLVRLV